MLVIHDTRDRRPGGGEELEYALSQVRHMGGDESQPLDDPLTRRRNMSRTFRNGALGALMDEYERAAGELARFLNEITDAEFELVRDKKTQDEHCRSIQTVVSHVVNSGYGYADYLRQAFSLSSHRPAFEILSRRECPDRLSSMLTYTADTLEGRWQYTDEQITAVQIHSRWGPQYDAEQMLEHAIVHILRHRRQIERFLAERSAEKGS